MTIKRKPKSKTLSIDKKGKITVSSARSPKQIAKERIKEQGRKAFDAERAVLESQIAKARGEGYAAGFFAGREDIAAGLARLDYVGITRKKGKKAAAHITMTDANGRAFVWKKKKGKFGWHLLTGEASSTQ